MSAARQEIQDLEEVAQDLAGILRALANERRLMIICKLAEWGEAKVTTLAEEVGLSPSALSQHLAKLRQRNIVDYRRDSQMLWYRISDPRIEKLFVTLHGLFCRQPRRRSTASGGNTRRRERT